MPHLRPSVAVDVPGIHSLIAGIFADYGFEMDFAGCERHLVEPGTYARATGGEFWVVDAGGIVLGTIGLLLHEHAGEIKSLYVHRSLRRQGWGERLVMTGVDYTNAAGRARTILWSDTRFLDAHRLYGRLGFRRGGIRELHDAYDSKELYFERRSAP